MSYCYRPYQKFIIEYCAKPGILSGDPEGDNLDLGISFDVGKVYDLSTLPQCKLQNTVVFSTLILCICSVGKINVALCRRK